MLKKLHFLSHGVTLVIPLSRQYYSVFRAIFLRLQEFVTVTNFVSFSILFIHRFDMLFFIRNVRSGIGIQESTV